MQLLFNKIISEGISPTGYYILICLCNDLVPNKSVVTAADYRMLEISELLDGKQPTGKAYKLLERISREFQFDDTIGKVKKKKDLPSEDVKYVEQYRELFPKGMLPSGQPSRVTIKELEKKFQWFFSVYKYDWETILKATRHYVEKYKQDNYMYMKTSGYFISKTERGVPTSTLATYCDMILDGGCEPDRPTYSSHTVI